MPLAQVLQTLPPVSPSAPVSRQVDYMRISVTDRCNERCLYCLPEQFQDWSRREEILTYEEILAIVATAVERGFKYFRVTGGEPLVRRDISCFLRKLIGMPGVESVQLSTNGTLLPEMAEELYEAGLRRLNISLDALDPIRYREITHGDIKPVLAGIRVARAIGFTSIKLNTVLIRHKNETEIWPLAEFAASLQIPVRFIELMPVSLTEMLTEENFLPVGEVMAMLSERDKLIPQDIKMGHGPAKYYWLKKTGALVGFIGALTNLHFCEACNKVRLTADGHLRPCLGQHGEYDLKPGLRPSVNQAVLRARLDQALTEKPPEHAFRDNWQPRRIMTAIGG
ncbi:MAG TPA: GTP 3',8-cyclase MoaA [Candidatus Methylacidiphilales bacterium]|nr:GTP 3',8-cyclase MoaA [Candidatus Methylacidiphilales bacterium]